MLKRVVRLELQGTITSEIWLQLRTKTTRGVISIYGRSLMTLDALPPTLIRSLNSTIL